MQLLKFVPIKLTLFLALGILIADYFNTTLRFAIILCLAFFILLAFLFFRKHQKNTILFGITMGITTISVGILALSLWQPINWPNHYSHQNISKTVTWHIKIREVLKPTSFSDRYVGIVHKVGSEKASGKIIMSFSNDSLIHRLHVDDELIIQAKPEVIRSPLNPHQFDYKKYTNRLGIYHQIQLNLNNYVLLKNSSTTLYGLAASFRNKIIHKLRLSNFGEEELAIIQALLLGQRNSISDATYDNYKNAGAIHILAVSGLHIGILLVLLELLLQPLERLPKGKTIKLVTVVTLLWGFALLAGLSASIVRAVSMFTFVAYALYLNRPSNAYNILALSMFFILLVFNPTLLFQAGFQMSYAAVFAIVWGYPLLQRFWNPKNLIVRKIWQLLSVSVTAQLGVLPISLFYFHQFPGLFFISNLIIVPFLGIILGVGILVIVLAFFNALPNFLVDGYNTLIKWMNIVIEWVAQQETFVFKSISFDAGQLFLAYAIIIGLFTVLTKSNFKRVAVFLCSIIAFQLWSFYNNYQTQKTENLFLAHQTKNSILMHQKGNTLHIFSKNKTTTQRLVSDYSIAERTHKIIHDTLKNSYTVSEKRILIIDSLGVYPKNNPHVDYLILTQSPKINFERVLDSIRPKQIIVDGSNYRSYINRWKRTCLKRKLPFHYTGEKGAFYFE